MNPGAASSNSRKVPIRCLERSNVVCLIDGSGRRFLVLSRQNFNRCFRSSLALPEYIDATMSWALGPHIVPRCPQHLGSSQIGKTLVMVALPASLVSALLFSLAPACPPEYSSVSFTYHARGSMLFIPSRFIHLHLFQILFQHSDV